MTKTILLSQVAAVLGILISLTLGCSPASNESPEVHSKQPIQDQLLVVGANDNPLEESLVLHDSLVSIAQSVKPLKVERVSTVEEKRIELTRGAHRLANSFLA